MDEINQLLSIDFKTWIVALFVILVAVKAVAELFEWFVNKIGLETGSMRRKREDRELLSSLSDNIKTLTEKHNQDVSTLMNRDIEIENELRQSVQEIKLSSKETQEKIHEFTENRIHDRQQSLEIQRQLLDCINKITSDGEKQDEQLQNIIDSQRELLGDKINHRYKRYLSLGGIPEDEVDEFINIHLRYKACGGNHNGDMKFEYVMEHLPVIPVETTLKAVDKEI